jgi:hypothetical protein
MSSMSNSWQGELGKSGGKPPHSKEAQARFM